MTAEVVTQPLELERLASRWDELARLDSRDGFFRTFIWYKAWLTHIRPDAEPFVVLVRGSDGRIVGLAPLCRLVYRDLGFHVSAVAWGGREVVSGDFLNFVAEPGVRPDVLRAIVDCLWEHRAEWSMLVLGELIEGDASYRTLEQAATRRRLAIRRQEYRVCPFIALPPTFEAYLATLGSATRYHIRRRAREVEKRGGVVRVYSTPDELVRRLDTLVELHRSRWQKDDQPGTFGRAGFVDCLKEVFAHPPDGARWRLYQLEIDGRAAAALLTFYFGESALYYQAGWDPNSPVASLSPGVVLMARSIADAIDHGLQYYEFLRGDEAYKSRWTKTHRTTVTLLLARGVTARAYLQVARAKDVFKQLVAARAARSGGPPQASAPPLKQTTDK